MKQDKVSRVLGLYLQLFAGQTVQKAAAAQQYGVNERSIQRDIEDIRAFCQDGMALGSGVPCEIVYDHVDKGYRMEGGQVEKLSNSEILALCKILLDSRAFVKTEMEEMLRKVISCCVPASNQAMVTRLVNNEAFHYVEPRHRTSFLDTMWHLGEAIQQHRYVDVAYGRLKDRKIVQRRLKPLALLFSEYYFYLIAFIDDKDIEKIYESARKAPGTLRRRFTAWTGSRPWMLKKRPSTFLTIGVSRKASSASASSSCTADGCSASRSPIRATISTLSWTACRRRKS